MTKTYNKKLFKKAFDTAHSITDKHFLSETVDTKKRFDPALTDGKRLAFSKSSKIIGREQLENILAPMGAIVVGPAKASAGTQYKDCGFLVKWNDTHYSTLLKAMALPRKSFSPDRLGIGGKVYSKSDLVQFRADIEAGVKNACDTDNKLYNAVISMLDNVEFSTPLSHDLLKLNKKVLNPIICDFGEVVCAYKDLLSNKVKKIEFPTKSNQEVVDYWRDGKIISVKGPLGGGKLNLVAYKDKLSKLPESKVLNFLLAHSTHNRESYFEYASEICPWVKNIKDLVGGTTVNHLQIFVNKKGSFDTFYNLLKTKNFPGVGVPKTNQKDVWRRVWEQEQSLDPIWFSIITLMTRFGATDKPVIKLITDIMRPLFTTEKFLNISVSGDNLMFDEILFKDVKSWSTHYHSNAGGAWANWPSIKILE